MNIHRRVTITEGIHNLAYILFKTSYSIYNYFKKEDNEKLYVEFYLHTKSMQVKPNRMKMGRNNHYVNRLPRISFLFTRSLL